MDRENKNIRIYNGEGSKKRSGKVPGRKRKKKIRNIGPIIITVLTVMVCLTIIAVASSISQKEPEESKIELVNENKTGISSENEKLGMIENIKELFSDEKKEKLETENDGEMIIACVGDSITYGDGVDDKDTETYPAYLQEILGNAVKVENFGKNGATLQDEGDLPYRETDQYEDSLESKADVFIIMLGSNDTKEENWDRNRYRKELKSLTKEYESLSYAKENIILMAPPRPFARDGEEKPDYGIDDEIVGDDLLSIIRNLAETRGYGFIDLYEVTRDKPEWYADGIHPNAEGNKELAKIISEKLPEMVKNAKAVENTQETGAEESQSDESGSEKAAGEEDQE